MIISAQKLPALNIQHPHPAASAPRVPLTDVATLSAANMRPALRARRDLQGSMPASNPRQEKINQFADALVERGDRQLAADIANGLIRVKLEKNASVESEQIAIPNDSTFRQRWSELANALHSEPFKSFAQANDIDLNTIMIDNVGRLIALKNDTSYDIYSRTDDDWAHASVDVLAAVEKLSIWDLTTFSDKDVVSLRNLIAFYDLPRSTTGDDVLPIIEKLLKGTFPAPDKSNKHYTQLVAKRDQEKKEARQAIADLPPHQLNQRLAEFAPLTASERVKCADKELAALCSQALIKLLPEPRSTNMGLSASEIILNEIPEYSTFNQTRAHLLKALSSDVFTNFLQKNNITASSIRFLPDSGELTGKVEGQDKTFTLNDVSDWPDIWEEIKNAVQQMAGGSGAAVKYPAASASLDEVMRFYNEPVPERQGSTQQPVVSVLRRIAEMSQNKGFKALVDTTGNNAASQAVRKRQQAVSNQLSDTSIKPSRLEALAQAIKSSDADSVETEAESAESALAIAMYRAMLVVKADPTQASNKIIDSIPHDSLFGQWWDYLGKALNARGFIAWAREQKVDLASLRYDPSDQALVGKVNGMDRRYTANDFAEKYPGYFDVLTPVLNAAAPFATRGAPMKLPGTISTNAPFESVCNFYGISTHYSGPAFAQQTQMMGRTQQFPTPVEDTDQIVNDLIRKKTALGDSNDRYALIDQLKIVNKDEGGSTRINVDPDSSHRPKGNRTVQQFVLDNNWNNVTSTRQTDNLLKALQTPVPQSPPLGNLWGFLSTKLPLSDEQRNKVTLFVKNNIAPHNSLWSYLSAGITGLSTQPDKALEQLLSSDKAVEFAAKLEIDMEGLTTATSLKQWLLTALTLELDPKAGASRNTVAGFDFMHADNWGLHPNEISERFDQHLIDTAKVPTSLAPLASHLLKSGMAPQFVRKDLPSSATLGSCEFAIYTMGVNLVELIAPGAATGMSDEQVIRFIGIDPISDDETQQRAMAGMNPVMDWAISNGYVVKNDNDEYTLEQMATAQKALNKQNTEVSAAGKFLSTVKAPNRRAMTLEALRAKFGSNIDFQNTFEWEKVWLIFSGVRATVASVYEAGRLGESWTPETQGVDFENFRRHASELPVINDKFNDAIEQDYPQRRHHYISHLKDMLSRLPLKTRVALKNGGMNLFAVGNTGGIVIDLDHYGEKYALAFYPASGKIIQIPTIDRSVYHGKPVNLTIDLKAFQTGAEPKPELVPNVVLTPLDRVDPDIYKGGRRLLLAEQAGTTPANYESIRFQHLAEVLVDSAYLHKASFINKQRGHNNVENALKPSDVFLGFMKVVPGGSSILDIYNGEYKKAVYDLGVDIILYAATEGVGKLWTLAKSSAAWAAAKVSAKFIEKFGAKEGEEIVLRDLTVNSTSQSLLSTHRLQHSHLAELRSEGFVQPSNMADGIVTSAGTAEPVKVTAMFQDGHWYDYDSKTAQAGGQVLKGFVSDTTSLVQKETFSDGTSALVAQKSLAEDAFTLPRVNGFDLINEGKVYRYDTHAPGVLTDLESADHFKPLEGFEAICRAPTGLTGRFRRGANDTCFSKIIDNVSSELTQELQALEHVRLFPSEPKLFKKDQFVIFERRRFKLVEGEMGPQLMPVLDKNRITYKDVVKGTIKQDAQFGFYNAQPTDALARESRVVKLSSISTVCDDKRELRGIVVKDSITGSTHQYLVIEADIGEFYFARLNKAPGDELTFIKCTPRELPLVKSYKAKLNIRQGVSNIPIDHDFIALPKLDRAFQALERSGYTRQKVDELKVYCREMTPEQQREVVYQLQRHDAIGKADIALKPIQVAALDKPADFATRTLEQQNKFYAEQAKSNVNLGMKATGLGPGNQVRSTADKARAQAAFDTIGWIRRTAESHAPNRANLVLKTGAGNCGEMAILSKDIINKSGGRAYEWHASDAHAFTVVGGPSTLPSGTVDFSEQAWKDAWIVDPWTDIACPAREYTQKLKEVMTQWERKKIKILEGEALISPLDKNWMENLITKPKNPYPYGYNRS
ncbi:hypothetical protein [Pseudomonas trivialis]|uniref:Uncharacterized protein n=1 Tax=Pseudomonas trivialis TaxID=200450 RepID=A0A0R2ZDJ0_9PSED|nr:hypothetical protein [Pseudomonas trivialis]KRP58794.1 hypothetical protein TU79_18740 [Pseudomonas trivialis]SDS95984.1 hypothetical protein SAMN04490205_4237 [Pseudomonas trivialis]